MTSQELQKLRELQHKFDLTKDWSLPNGGGGLRVPKWNNNTGKYEPDPDDH